MEKYLESLNAQQYEAVTTESQFVRVIAGAGSGKTRVLTSRIVYLIEQWGIIPETILAITFTNKAANEMKQRIQKQLINTSSEPHVSTIHSFCVTFLRNEIRREGYPTNFTILDGDDQKSIIREGLKQYALSAKDHPIDKVLDYIGNNKTAGFAPEEARKTSLSNDGQVNADLYQYYVDRCHQLYGLDFDDLLLWTVKILKKYPAVRRKWQDKFHFILVDEYQDIDRIQNEIINLLTCQDTYLYVVGDPDQTIYTWRGADINVILGFDGLYDNVKTIILNENYRSTSNILNGANSLIKNNRDRVKKDLFTANEEGDKILHFTAGSDEGEAGFVVAQINKMLKAGIDFKDIAILYRSAYLSRNIEKHLMDFKIPYIIFGGVRFYERAEVKDMLSYLRMLLVKDDLSLKRIINQPKRGIGEKSVDNLFTCARRNGVSLYEAIDLYDESPKTQAKMLEFKKQVEDWIERSHDLTLERIFQMVFEESGYKKMLESSEDPKDSERLENVKELLNDIKGFQEAHPEFNLEEYLANVALYTDIQDNNNGNHVSLMTIHAAKGLEFDNVFVIDLSEGIFPNERSVSEKGHDALEEERRLAYVAFTRARKRLILTDSNGYSYTTSMAKNTSRFVDEIDSRYIKHLGMTSLNDSHSTTSSNDSWMSKTSNKTTSKTKYKVGDSVIHDTFGEGIIISISADNTQATIAFPYPYMSKTIALSFPKLHKKEN